MTITRAGSAEWRRPDNLALERRQDAWRAMTSHRTRGAVNWLRVVRHFHECFSFSCVTGREHPDSRNPNHQGTQDPRHTSPPNGFLRQSPKHHLPRPQPHSPRRREGRMPLELTTSRVPGPPPGTALGRSWWVGALALATAGSFIGRILSRMRCRVENIGATLVPGRSRGRCQRHFLKGGCLWLPRFCGRLRQSRMPFGLPTPSTADWLRAQPRQIFSHQSAHSLGDIPAGQWS